MEVTRHGKTRIKERLGLPKGVSEKNAEKAFNEGLRHGECKGDLKRYVDKQFLVTGKGRDYRVYNHYIYVFSWKDHRLITVMDLPTRLCALADKLQKKKSIEIKDSKE